MASLPKVAVYIIKSNSHESNYNKLKKYLNHPDFIICDIPYNKILWKSINDPDTITFLNIIFDKGKISDNIEISKTPTLIIKDNYYPTITCDEFAQIINNIIYENEYNIFYPNRYNDNLSVMLIMPQAKKKMLGDKIFLEHGEKVDFFPVSVPIAKHINYFIEHGGFKFGCLGTDVFNKASKTSEMNKASDDINGKTDNKITDKIDNYWLWIMLAILVICGVIYYLYM